MKAASSPLSAQTEFSQTKFSKTMSTATKTHWLAIRTCTADHSKAGKNLDRQRTRSVLKCPGQVPNGEVVEPAVVVHRRRRSRPCHRLSHRQHRQRWRRCQRRLLWPRHDGAHRGTALPPRVALLHHAGDAFPCKHTRCSGRQAAMREEHESGGLHVSVCLGSVKCVREGRRGCICRER